MPRRQSSSLPSHTLPSTAALEDSSIAPDENRARLSLRASLRRNLASRFPRPGFEQLCHGQMDTVADPGLDLAVELVDEHQRHGPPLDDRIIARVKQRQVPARRRLQASVQRLLFQSQDAHVDEQAAVAILGQGREGVGVAPLHPQHPLEGDHEGVGEPLRQFVEGLDAFRSCVSALGSVRSSLQDAQRPRVANRRSGDGRAVLGPGGNEKGLENVPENEDVEIGGSVACCFGYQIV